MEVTRIFHPVGQGAFYTESFDDNHMVVYDCGGSCDMEKYIDSLVKKQQSLQIEAVFISHLHNDHINGLQHLLRKANVKRLFLPHFSKEKIFEALFYNTIHAYKDSEVINFIVSLLSHVRTERPIGDCQITTVSESHNNDEEMSYLIEGSIPRNIHSGAHIKKGPHWVYIPYNVGNKRPKFKNVDPIYQKVLQKIYNEKSAEKQAHDIADFVKKTTVGECKKIYKSLYGGVHNTHSMPVFSGVLINPYFDISIHSSNGPFAFDCIINKEYDFHFHTHNHCCEHNCELNLPVYHAMSGSFLLDKIVCNFLYTGDYEAKNEESIKQIKKFYLKHKVWDSIFGIQVPHHGSKHNYNSILYENGMYAVVSVGRSNHYGHPHGGTLNNIFKQKCLPIIVTEDPATAIEQYIHF